MSVKQLLIAKNTGGNSGMSYMANVGNDIYGYVDPFSGKTYSSTPYNEVVNRVRSAQLNIQQRLQSPTYSMSGSSLNQPYNPYGVGMASYATGNKNTQTLGQYLTSTLSSLKIPDKDKYVYQPDMDASYQKYSGNWMNYWEGSYKNPRLAEANAAKVNPNTQQVQTQDTKLQDTLRIPKAVGTGISSTGSLNPFGRLDAGLNI